ncbi:MAG TPA: ADOP family duplicated permease [Vicinamibacterales bacterium]|nr:ADOP family duplicated permease [Vicinamibacterales bacterium]
MVRPPRVPLWLMRLSLARAEREPVIGDLVEEFGTRALTGRRSATVWAWQQALRSFVPNLERRASHRQAGRRLAMTKGTGPMDGLITDARFALRLLRRQPLMTLIAWLSLTAGLGLNILLFTLANAILLRPLPLVDPDRLLVMLSQRPTGLNHNFSYRDYVALRDSATTVEALVAYSRSEASLTGTERTEPVRGEAVSGNFFGALGVPLRTGRGLTPADDVAGAPPAVVVSERFWRSHFGSARLAGQTLTLNGSAFSIVGIASSAFQGMQLGMDASFWVPLAHMKQLTGSDWLGRATVSWLTLIVRPRAQATPSAVQQELNARLGALFTDRGRQSEAVVLQPGARGDSDLPARLQSPLLLLMLAGWLVLLVACLNVANLQLVRTEARRLEFAVRSALGAARGQIVRLLLLDALVLASAAGMAGVVIAAAMKDRAVALMAIFGRPVSVATPIDLRVVGAALLFSLAAAIIVALLSTLRLTFRQPAAMLGDGRTSTTRGRTPRRGLVAAQFALAMALVTGAALLVRTLENLRSTDLGFDASRIAVIEVAPATTSVDPAAARTYFDEALRRVSALPGVERAAVAHVMPLDFGGSRMSVDVQGYSPQPDEDMELNFVLVTPGYFDTMGIPVLQGREFDGRDVGQTPRRVIVNEAMARRFWPGGAAVGRFVRWLDSGPYDIEVVGVAANVHYRMVREEPRPSFYVPFAQAPVRGGVIHARLAPNWTGRLDELRRAVAAAGPAMAIARTSTLGEQAERNIADERMVGAIGVTLASVALLLAAIGLYATMAFIVGRRTREIGVRLALGATAPEVSRMVVRESLGLVGSGIGAGLFLALWAGRALESQLYGVGAADPLSLLGAALVLATAALLASWVPARRASHVDPVVALREP